MITSGSILKLTFKYIYTTFGLGKNTFIYIDKLANMSKLESYVDVSWQWV